MARSRFQGSKINPDRFDRSQLGFYIVLTMMGIVMILPLIFVVSQAFKPLDELFLYPPRIFVQRPTLENYQNLFNPDSFSTVFTKDDDIGSAKSSLFVPGSRYLMNSIIVTVLIVLLATITSSMAGYALSKHKFKLKKVLFEVNMLALMFVPAAVMIPRYLVIQQLGLIDTYWAHILPAVAMPVMVFLVKQFADQIPDALIEAARIDGAGEIATFTRIILPMLQPAIATIVILSFQTAWNSMDASNYFINSESMKTFAFFISTLTSKTNIVAGAGMTAAAVLLMFLPNLVIFIFTQSKVMATMAHSGIK